MIIQNDNRKDKIKIITENNYKKYNIKTETTNYSKIITANNNQITKLLSTQRAAPALLHGRPVPPRFGFRARLTLFARTTSCSPSASHRNPSCSGHFEQAVGR